MSLPLDCWTKCLHNNSEILERGHLTSFCLAFTWAVYLLSSSENLRVTCQLRSTAQLHCITFQCNPRARAKFHTPAGEIPSSFTESSCSGVFFFLLLFKWPWSQGLGGLLTPLMMCSEHRPRICFASFITLCHLRILIFFPIEKLQALLAAKINWELCRQHGLGHWKGNS